MFAERMIGTNKKEEKMIEKMDLTKANVLIRGLKSSLG